jgi:hypothetical protein
MSRSCRARCRKPPGERPVALAGPRGVDVHRGLEPEPVGEREQLTEGGDPERPLARQRRRQLEAGQPPHRPPREPERRPHPAPDPAREGGDREIALPPLDRLHQRPQSRRGAAEIGVAQQHDPVGCGTLAQHRLGGSGDVRALAVRAPSAHHLGTAEHRGLAGLVPRRVVGDPHLRGRERPTERGERVADPIGLVLGGDDDHRPLRPHRVPAVWAFRWHLRVLCRAEQECPTSRLT